MKQEVKKLLILNAPYLLLEQSGKWGAKSKKEYLLDKDGQRIKLKNGTFKSRKVDTVDWNSQEKAEVWRQAWADIANRYLAAQDRPERIDHRSYKRQGIEQMSETEIAKLNNIPRTTVRYRRTSSFELLKRYLEEHAYDYTDW